MDFSFNSYTGDGNTRSYTFSFAGQDEGYIREEDIQVTVDGADRPFTLLSTNTLELSTAPSDGAEIIIRRVMPKELPYSDFRRGNNFGPENLNRSFLQLLYIVHELLDGYFPSDFVLRESVDFGENLTISGDLEVKGKTNLGDLTVDSLSLEGAISGVQPDLSDGSTAMSLDTSDSRYVNVSGDSMQGDLDTRGHRLFVSTATQGSHAVAKTQLDSLRDYVEQITAQLQSQISGATELEASAFSPISWHKQRIESNVEIPASVNAWSFGPEVTVEEGVVITVGPNSAYTVANGEGESTPFSYDGGEL